MRFDLAGVGWRKLAGPWQAASARRDARPRRFPWACADASALNTYCSRAVSFVDFLTAGTVRIAYGSAGGMVFP